MTEDAARALERVFRSVLSVASATDIGSVSAESRGEWDSLAHINLILAVEQEFGFTMTPEEASAARSFQAMLELVRRKRLRP